MPLLFELQGLLELLSGPYEISARLERFRPAHLEMRFQTGRSRRVGVCQKRLVFRIRLGPLPGPGVELGHPEP